MKSQKPRVTSRPAADEYAQPRERIIEFSHPSGNGNGGLISIVARDNGTLSVFVYRTNGTELQGTLLPTHWSQGEVGS